MVNTRYKIEQKQFSIFVEMKCLCYFFVFPLLCLMFTSCNKPVTKQELTTYLNDPDNGLKQEVKIGSYKISLTYRPTDLLVEQDLFGDTTVETIEAKRTEYNAYYYFILNMSLGENDVLYKGSTNQLQFSASLNKLNFGLSEYIYAIADEKDTINLADYYVPNLYGMGGTTQILLVFPKDISIIYEELEVTVKELGFGTGQQKFKFKIKDMNNVPELKLLNAT